MRTYPDEAKPIGFEIDNAYISLRTVARKLRSIDGVNDVKLRRLFTKWEEVHIWFRYHGHDFVVIEPFGDSSRYWIGPKDENDHSTDVHALQEVFAKYVPPLPRKIFGDLITLNFRALFHRGA